METKSYDSLLESIAVFYSKCLKANKLQELQYFMTGVYFTIRYTATSKQIKDIEFLISVVKKLN